MAFHLDPKIYKFPIVSIDSQSSSFEQNHIVKLEGRMWLGRLRDGD